MHNDRKNSSATDGAAAEPGAPSSARQNQPHCSAKPARRQDPLAEVLRWPAELVKDSGDRQLAWDLRRLFLQRQADVYMRRSGQHTPPGCQSK